LGGAYLRQEILDTIVYEVKNKLKPDVILVTGDLTDEGYFSIQASEHRNQEAYRYLS